MPANMVDNFRPFYNPLMGATTKTPKRVHVWNQEGYWVKFPVHTGVRICHKKITGIWYLHS